MSTRAHKCCPYDPVLVAGQTLNSRFRAIVWLLWLCFLGTAGSIEQASAASFSACAHAYYTAGLVGCGAVPYQPLLDQGVDVKAVLSSSIDGEDTYRKESAAAAAYGSDLSGQGRVLGLGIEPMADVRGLVEVTGLADPTSITYASVTSNATASVRQRVSAIVGTPEEIANAPVSLLLAWGLSLSQQQTAREDAVTSNFSAGFTVTGSSVGGQQNINEHVDKTYQNWDPFGISPYLANTQDYVTITASASVSLYMAAGVESQFGNSYAQAVADPFLYVDPTWQYAQYFVVEQESLLHPGEWVPVTREWQQPVPEPQTWGMLLAGLCLVGVTAQRRKQART
jgi:hypothetical protein